MNCDQVEARLSDYLDRSLDSATHKDVEEHLLSCPRCGAEAEELADCQRRLANLDTIDPPIGFTERVMARVGEIEAKPSLWERLLFPLSFKLPIHATAVVLIGLMALYLLKRVPSGEEADQAVAPAFGIGEKKKDAGASNAGQNLGEVAQRNEAGNKSASIDTQVAASKPQPGAAAERVKRRGSGEGLTALADRQSGEKELKGVLPSSAPPEKSNSATEETGRASGKSLTENAPSNRVPGTAELRERATAEPSAALPSSPDAGGGRTTSVPAQPAMRQLGANPDIELVARRARPANAQRRDSLGAFSKSMESESIPRQEAAKRSAPLLPEIPLSDKPQEVWLTITRAQYDQLKRELLLLGSIESESWLSSREKDTASPPEDRLRIKLTVLPLEP